VPGGHRYIARMADPALLLRLALVGALAGALVAEVASAPAPIVLAGPTTPVSRAAPQAASRPAGQDPIAAEVAAMLARPLFRVDRRPPRRPDGAPAAGPHEAGLPRLSGILVSADQARAIFEGGSKPLVAHVGDRLGDYTIAAIATGSVTLDGPQGTQTIVPSFDRDRTPPPPPAIVTTDTERLLNAATANGPIPPAQTLRGLMNQRRAMHASEPGRPPGQ